MDRVIGRHDGYRLGRSRMDGNKERQVLHWHSERYEELGDGTCRSAASNDPLSSPVSLHSGVDIEFEAIPDPLRVVASAGTPGGEFTDASSMSIVVRSDWNELMFVRKDQV